MGNGSHSVLITAQLTTQKSLELMMMSDSTTQCCASTSNNDVSSQLFDPIHASDDDKPVATSTTRNMDIRTVRGRF